MENTLFEVKEYPALYIDDNNKKETMHRQNGYKFIVREDNGAILSCMTNQYQLITNEEVYNTMAPVLKQYGASPIEANVFSGGARTSWRWKFPDVQVDVGEGDLVNPEITIRNSYDGSFEASAIAGAFRIVCSNGLVIGYLLGKTGVRHIVGNKKDTFYQLVEDTIKMTKKVFNDEFPTIANTEIKKADVRRVIELFPSGQAMEALVNYLVGKPPRTYWDLLNAATWVTSHSMDRNREATHKLENKIYPLIKKRAMAQA